MRLHPLPLDVGEAGLVGVFQNSVGTPALSEVGACTEQHGVLLYNQTDIDGPAGAVGKIIVNVYQEVLIANTIEESDEIALDTLHFRILEKFTSLLQVAKSHYLKVISSGLHPTLSIYREKTVKADDISHAFHRLLPMVKGSNRSLAACRSEQPPQAFSNKGQ